MPDVDIATVNNDGESALDFAIDHPDCLSAISEKAPSLHPKSPPPADGSEKSESRKEAEYFVKRLQNHGQWGVYNVENPGICFHSSQVEC